MGRWSRVVARRLLAELALPDGLRWLDVGCGVGTVTEVLLQEARPRTVVAVDPSAAFVAHARERVAGPSVQFLEGVAERLPLVDDVVDVAISGLAVNFFAEPATAMREQRRVLRRGGVLTGYVWDYDYEDFFLTRFWDAVNPERSPRVTADERGRWKVCSVGGMQALIAAAQLDEASVWPIVVQTPFVSADELWSSFLLGVGPSGDWAVGLDDQQRALVRSRIERSLPPPVDGALPLTARAIAVRARTP